MGETEGSAKRVAAPDSGTGPAAVVHAEIGEGGRVAGIAAVAMLLLAPLVTALLPSGLGFLVEVGPTAGALALVLLAGIRRPVAAWRALPSAVRWGMVLYVGAVCSGTVVGVASGHAPVRVASQSLAMTFLVVAVIAFWRFSGFSGESLVAGLGVASGVLLLMRMVASSLPPLVVARFAALDAFAGGGVLAALVALAFLLRRRSVLTLAAAFVTTLIALGRTSDGSWAVMGIGLVVLGACAFLQGRLPGRGALAIGSIVVVAAAVVMVIAPLRGPTPSADGGGEGSSARAPFRLEVEIAEWRVVREQWRWAPAARQLAGQGLGALEPLAGLPAGQRLPRRAIHNLYTFLVYQLGLAGLVALVGLVLLILGSLEAVRDQVPSWYSEQGWSVCAAVSVWVAYLLWGVTSAELLDLRIAALLGVMVALPMRKQGLALVAGSGKGPFGRVVLRAVLIAFLLLVVAIPWYHKEPRYRIGQVEMPNVILLSIDTLRADHLGCYGYSRDTSPVLDRLAGESLLYTNTQAPAPWTLPSHVGMLSGIHPFDLGIRSRSAKIPGGAPLLAERLAASGYRTAAFVDSTPDGYLGVRRGFGRGFDLYRHAPHAGKSPFRYNMANTVDAATRWLSRHDFATPFFLFLHTKSVHSVPDESPGRPPYDQPTAYRNRFRPPEQAPWRWVTADGKGGSRYLSDLNQRLGTGVLRREDVSTELRQALVDLYDAGVYFVDEQVGRLLEKIESSGLRDNTILIVTADHGEAFLEHRQFLHEELYRQLLHVPLIVRLPGQGEGVVSHQLTTLTDIVPTILDFVGLPLDAQLSGRPLPRGERPEQPSRSLFAYLGFSEARDAHQAYALQGSDWKVVYHDFLTAGVFVSERFDPRADPAEQRLIEDRSDATRTYLRALERRLLQEPAHDTGTIEVDEETKRLLRSLGYL